MPGIDTSVTWANPAWHQPHRRDFGSLQEAEAFADQMRVIDARGATRPSSDQPTLTGVVTFRTMYGEIDFPNEVVRRLRDWRWSISHRPPISSAVGDDLRTDAASALPLTLQR